MIDVQYCNLGRIDYEKAWDLQRELFQLRRENKIKDTLLFLEHPHTFTLGKTGSMEHLLLNDQELNKEKIHFSKIDRGGDITYHGPGQLVVYPIIQLSEYYKDVHRYLRELEQVIIEMLNVYNIDSDRIDGLTGVWVDEKKICAMGVKISRWITMHGLAFNVSADLNYFNKIIPCGIQDKSVCNLNDLLDKNVSLEDVMNEMIPMFNEVFNMSCQLIDKQELNLQIAA